MSIFVIISETREDSFEQLEVFEDNVRVKKNTTRSKIRIQPTWEDDRAKYTCEGIHPALSSPIRVSVYLSVQCKLLQLLLLLYCYMFACVHVCLPVLYVEWRDMLEVRINICLRVVLVGKKGKEMVYICSTSLFHAHPKKDRTIYVSYYCKDAISFLEMTTDTSLQLDLKLLLMVHQSGHEFTIQGSCTRDRSNFPDVNKLFTSHLLWHKINMSCWMGDKKFKPCHLWPIIRP